MIYQVCAYQWGGPLNGRMETKDFGAALEHVRTLAAKFAKYQGVDVRCDSDEADWCEDVGCKMCRSGFTDEQLEDIEQAIIDGHAMAKERAA